MTTVAALAFAVVAAGVIAFQLALAAGAPWGRYAMGGRYPDRFPPPLRVAAVVQALVIAVLALIVLSAADLVTPGLVDAVPWLPWLAVVFAAGSLVLNVITPSAAERRIWAPIALVLLVSGLIAALGMR